MKKAITILLSLSTSICFAITAETERKIDLKGVEGGEVMSIAGSPDVRQFDGACVGGRGEKWFYRGTDSVLAGKTVVVELCGNRVTRVTRK